MRFKSLLLVVALSLFALSLVLPSGVSAQGLPTFLHLNKWEKEYGVPGWYMGNLWGMLEYYPAGPKFKFYFYAHNKIPDVAYKLIACPDFTPVGTKASCDVTIDGTDYPICLGYGVANANGLLSINGLKGKEINTSLNDALIVLVRSADVNCTAHTIKFWKPIRFISEFLSLCEDDPTPPCCASQEDMDQGFCEITSEDGYLFGYHTIDYVDTNAAP
jgi:hypothetical protein